MMYISPSQVVAITDLRVGETERQRMGSDDFEA
jgi:hypothetical protein